MLAVAAATVLWHRWHFLNAWREGHIPL